MATPGGTSRERAATTLVRATGTLCSSALARMDDDLPWFAELGAEERAWVGQIVQAGVCAFVDWYREESAPAASTRRSGDAGDADDRVRTSRSESFALAASVFGAAPRALAGTISLQQTVDLVRLSIAVVEHDVDALLDPDDVSDVQAAILAYGREVAFATAEVYTRAAEMRGAWDARLEALVVDAVLRGEADEAVLSRASAVGWSARGDVAVVLGSFPAQRTETDLFDAVRRASRAAGMDALCAAQGDRLVVLLGGVSDARAAATSLVDLFGAGPVVSGPISADLEHAHVSARAALAAHRAAPGWPDAPRPALSVELLPERALAGDGHARRFLVDQVHRPLVTARGELAETLAVYLGHGGSIEGSARSLYIHVNTVRYRLRQIAELTGYSPQDPRDAFVLQVALVLGRLSARPAP